MIAFEVHDMTCGDCVSSITKAVRATDPGAQVNVDLATHRVRIEPAESNGTEQSDAIRGAGYTPVPVDDGAAPVEQVCATQRRLLKQVCAGSVPHRRRGGLLVI